MSIAIPNSLAAAVCSLTSTLSGTLSLLGSFALVATVRLVERRGRDKRELNPQRQIEISTLLESMPEAILIFDANGTIIEANTAAERVFRLNTAGIKKLTAADITNYLAEGCQECVPHNMAVNRALRGETVQQERRAIALPRGDGFLEALVSANPIRNTEGKVVGALIIVRDVTELAVLQGRMADAERHNVVGKMAAGLAHDFNNVLDTISQAVSVMELDPNRPVDERLLIARMIRNAVRRGAEIVSGVRRFLVGHRDEAYAVDLNQVLEEAIELTRPLWQASHKISIQRHFQPVRCVRANSNELRRVFTNLVINSIEAMPNGGTLTVGCEEKPGRVLAFVADTGEGIPEDKKRHIFSPYFTTKAGGTGLGLASAERAVRNVQGEISFESHEGQGTRFCLEFPALLETDDLEQTA